jgi:hypothetical protein
VVVVYKLAGCDRAQLGYQNKVLDSRGVPPERLDEKIGFTTSAHPWLLVGHSEPLSDEERDTTEQRIKNEHVHGRGSEIPLAIILLVEFEEVIYTSGVPIDALFVFVIVSKS